MGNYEGVVELYKYMFNFSTNLPNGYYLFRNLRKQKKMISNHHCDVCNQSMCEKCYKQLHYGFCLAKVGKDGSKARCGERFLVNSRGGCGKHEYNQEGEVNKIFKDVLNGKTKLTRYLEKEKTKARKEKETEEKEPAKRNQEGETRNARRKGNNKQKRKQK